MCHIYTSSDKKLYMRCLLEKYICQHRGPVSLGKTLGSQVMYRNIFLGKLKKFPQGKHSLCSKIYPVDKADRRYILVRKVETRFKRFIEISGYNLRTCPAANHLFALSFHKSGHIEVVLLLIHRRAYHNINIQPFTKFNRSHGSVISRLVQVEVIAG